VNVKCHTRYPLSSPSHVACPGFSYHLAISTAVKTGSDAEMNRASIAQTSSKLLMTKSKPECLPEKRWYAIALSRSGCIGLESGRTREAQRRRGRMMPLRSSTGQPALSLNQAVVPFYLRRYSLLTADRPHAWVIIGHSCP
jgi:hypothetical protein